MPCPINNREASSGIRWEQVQKSTTRHYEERLPNLKVFFGSTISGILGNPQGKGEKRLSEAEGREVTRRSQFTKLNNQGSQRLIQTELASTGLHGSVWDPLQYMLWLLGWCFCGNPSRMSRCIISKTFVYSWDYLSLDCHLQPQ